MWNKALSLHTDPMERVWMRAGLARTAWDRSAHTLFTALIVAGANSDAPSARSCDTISSLLHLLEMISLRANSV